MFFPRLLGHFGQAAKDLRTACKLDFDEVADEWLKEVTPNVSTTLALIFNSIRNSTILNEPELLRLPYYLRTRTLLGYFLVFKAFTHYLRSPILLIFNVSWTLRQFSFELCQKVWQLVGYGLVQLVDWTAPEVGAS